MRNATGVADRVEFVRTSIFDNIQKEFDFIASNPPYVAEPVRDTLQPEVREHEPEGALFAGRDGLAVIRQLLQHVWSRLKPDAPFVFEFGFGQAQDVSVLIADAPRVELTGMKNDLQGIPRAAIVTRN
jgi:release factor glutamine methyltransferase